VKKKKKKKKKQQQLKKLKKLKWILVGYSQLCLLLGGGGIRDKQRETQRERMLNFEFALDNPAFSDRILNLEVIPSAQAPPSASTSSSSSSSSQVPNPLIFNSSVFFCL
jgi:hypothetical protein